MNEAVLATIQRRFAGRRAAVAHMYADSGSFRTLCQDYATCLAALEGWRASEALEAATRLEEYEELLGELSDEIETRLDEAGR